MIGTGFCHLKPECGFFFVGVHPIFHPVGIQDRADDGETDSGAHAAAALVLAALVALPDDLFVFLGDRGAGVFHGKSGGMVTFWFQGDGNDIAFRGVIDGVVEEIPEYLAEF